MAKTEYHLRPIELDECFFYAQQALKLAVRARNKGELDNAAHWGEQARAFGDVLEAGGGDVFVECFPPVGNQAVIVALSPILPSSWPDGRPYRCKDSCYCQEMVFTSAKRALDLRAMANAKHISEMPTR